MKAAFTLCSCLFLWMPFTAPLRAELRECDGVWTNRSCSGQVKKSLNEEQRTTDPARKRKAQRELWLHDLEMKRLKAQREHRLDVEIDDVRLICNDMSITDVACKQAISDRRRRIADEILAADKIGEKEFDSEEQTEKANDSSSIQVIVQNNENHEDRWISPPAHHPHSEMNEHSAPEANPRPVGTAPNRHRSRSGGASWPTK